MEDLISNLEKYIEECGKVNLDSVDTEDLFKKVDILKDLKEVKNMNNYGRYDGYGDNYGNEYNNGNYGAKEDGLKDLESMLHYNHKLLKYIKETATSPEEQEIVKKHFMKFKEIMNV